MSRQSPEGQGTFPRSCGWSRPRPHPGLPGPLPPPLRAPWPWPGGGCPVPTSFSTLPPALGQRHALGKMPHGQRHGRRAWQGARSGGSAPASAPRLVRAVPAGLGPLLLPGPPQHAHDLHRVVGLRDRQLPHGYVEGRGWGGGGGPRGRLPQLRSPFLTGSWPVTQARSGAHSLPSGCELPGAGLGLPW